MHETAIGQIRQITPPMAVSEANSPPSEAISRCIRYSAQSTVPVMTPLFAPPERDPAVKAAIASDTSADAFISSIGATPLRIRYAHTAVNAEKTAIPAITGSSLVRIDFDFIFGFKTEKPPCGKQNGITFYFRKGHFIPYESDGSVVLLLAEQSDGFTLLGRFGVRAGIGRNGPLRDLNANLILAGLEGDGIFRNRDDSSHKAADGDDLITGAKAFAHLVELFLFLVFGNDHENIENQNHDNEKNNR